MRKKVQVLVCTSNEHKVMFENGVRRGLTIFLHILGREVVFLASIRAA